MISLHLVSGTLCNMIPKSKPLGQEALGGACNALVRCKKARAFAALERSGVNSCGAELVAAGAVHHFFDLPLQRNECMQGWRQSRAFHFERALRDASLKLALPDHAPSTQGRDASSARSHTARIDPPSKQCNSQVSPPIPLMARVPQCSRPRFNPTLGLLFSGSSCAFSSCASLQEHW